MGLFTDLALEGHNMKCGRCEGLMREEEILLSGDAVKRRCVSAWHCSNCGRIEYQPVVERDTIEEGTKDRRTTLTPIQFG